MQASDKCKYSKLIPVFQIRISHNKVCIWIQSFGGNAVTDPGSQINLAGTKSGSVVHNSDQGKVHLNSDQCGAGSATLVLLTRYRPYYTTRRYIVSFH